VNFAEALSGRAQELRWHLAQMLPRLGLRGAALMRSYLADPSRIVRAFALTALALFAEEDADLRPAVRASPRGREGGRAEPQGTGRETPPRPSLGLRRCGAMSIWMRLKQGMPGMAKGPTKSGRGERGLKVRVKTAKGRKLSSTRWLERQLNDPYVARARREGYRGRAAYKIAEIDDKYGFLKPGARVVDLGSAPGGWLQVAAARVNALGERAGKPRGRVIGIDLQEVEAVPGAEFRRLDFLEEGADAKVKAWLGGKADVVMSDMAPAASGQKQVDHIRIVALCEAAAELAFDVLEKGGTFVAKVLAGGAEAGLQAILKQRFKKVANVKPPSSRKDSSEKFVVATGFRG
jgi:23S rRNA (uridine2552-2'-O)-methyltransferase